jgi:hypothetical protein
MYRKNKQTYPKVIDLHKEQINVNQEKKINLKENIHDVL